MREMEPRTEDFILLSRRALQDKSLRRAISAANASFQAARSAAVAAVPDWEVLRERAAKIKDEALARLPELLEMLEKKITRRGGKVHWAETGADAARTVLELANNAGEHLAVKSKSMVTEEVGLNQVLGRGGVEAVETDLGEYLVQLAGETPSHIITPVIHKTRGEIASLLHEKLGTSPGADIPEMTQAARAALREMFLTAGIGISGVNFAVAETGTLVVVENEGNARMVTTLPRIHVAIMGIEKLVPRIDDLAVLLKLLCRSATGQAITTYVSFIGGPRSPGEFDGPQELHLVLLDGGRSRIWADPRSREVLRCIRCGACLNYCPVYERIGGHAYGWVYPGPIGSVITPDLIGIDRSRDLPLASSLCGRCGEVCPIKIPLPELLVSRRARSVASGHPGPPRGERISMGLFAFLASKSWRFGMARSVARIFLRLWLGRNPESRLFGPLRAWTQGRNFPRPPRESFRSAWRRLSPVNEPVTPSAGSGGEAGEKAP